MRTRGIAIPLAILAALQGCAGFAPARRAAPTPSVATSTEVTEPAVESLATPVPAPVAPPVAAAEMPAPVQIQKKPEEPPAKPAPPSSPERYVSLNFDNADISVVIQTIAELLRLNYIVSPSVRGRVTIQTTEKLPVSALLPVLEQILQVNNFTAIKSGDFYKIVPAAQAKQESVETVPMEAAATVGTGLVTKIVQLRHIGPGEVVKVLTPFKTAAGVYQAYEPARLLFLTEAPTKIADLMKIVEVLDVDTFASIQVELYPVRYASVDDLAKELTQIVTQVYTAAGRARTLFRILPVPQANAIMVFSGETGLAANVREWIAKLDLPASEANERIFVYPLSHATAETLAGVVEKVFRKEQTKAATKSTPTPAQTTPARATPGQPTAPTVAASLSAGVGESAAAAPVIVVPDKDTNSLIIQTAAWFYPTVEDVIRKLDVMPKQVLIEVLIAEISLDDTTQFGIQWALRGQGTVDAFGESHNLITSTALSAAAPNTAFKFMVTEAGRLTAALNAYAKDSKLNILASPHILASNNKEAKIDVGEEVPILKTRTTPTTGDLTTTVTNDVEYRPTGVILTVTPHVNEGGFVTLDLQQEVSKAQETTVGQNLTPIIRKRTAKTTMVVKDGQSLVVGGLIQETRTKSREGLPGLNKIPIIGYLFGSNVTSVQKTELVLIITPRVINNPEDGDRISREIKDRALTLKPGITEYGKRVGKEETP